MRNRIVTVVSKSVPGYRLPFFDRLRATLEDNQVDLRVIYGHPSQNDEAHWHAATLEWATRIDNRFVTLFGRQLIWQPCVRHAAQSDLIIVEQASKLITNHVFFALHSLGRIRLAFWGHGRNLKQHAASKLGEALKSFESKRVDWWFAYTSLTVDLLETMGVRSNIITQVDNTIDVQALQHAGARLTPENLTATREELGLEGANCGLYIGGMYPEKRLPFLLQSATIIRSLVPNFELLLLGAGPEESTAREAAAQFKWIHYVGPRLGEDKVPYFALSKLLLLPGLVGLTIVDSFALRVPLLTVDLPYHSPEIAYLRNHDNGVMLSGSVTPEMYAQAAAALLRDESECRKLMDGCARSAKAHGLDNMVRRFSDGVMLALASTNARVR